MNNTKLDNKHLSSKRKFRKYEVDYQVDMAFYFLYLFEEHCPVNREIANYIRSIEEILQSKFFKNPNQNYMDEIVGYQLYLVGYDYERSKENE